MIRPGRARDGRTTGLAAVVMLLLTLAAVALVSAGAAHHAAAGSPEVFPSSAPVNAVDESADDHEHGNDWTPVPGKRLRPAADVTLRSTVPAVLTAVSRPAPAEHDSDVSSSIEVLRV